MIKMSLLNFTIRKRIKIHFFQVSQIFIKFLIFTPCFPLTVTAFKRKSFLKISMFLSRYVEFASSNICYLLDVNRRKQPQLFRDMHTRMHQHSWLRGGQRRACQPRTVFGDGAGAEIFRS